MAKYAIYDPDTGQIKGYIDRDEMYLEIDALPGDGAGEKLVRHGRLVDAPAIRLAAPEQVFAGLAAEFTVDLPADYEHADVPAAGFELEIGAETLRWSGTSPFTFDEPGEYALKIVGPWPWKSNIVRLAVVESPKPEIPIFKEQQP